MLENTPIWTSGKMHLWVNNEPAKVFVPESNPKQAFQLLQSRLSKEGRIPIGIDHLPDDILEHNPILKKLDLLNVGEITQITYSDDAIQIAEAKLTNPIIRELYEAGELDMVSIVADSTTSECPRGDYDYIVDTTDITRVDIVEKGACKECNIPKPQSSDSTVVYARYSITNEMEEQDMSDGLTKEDIKAIFDESIDERIAPMQEQINSLIEASEPTEPAEPADVDDAKVKEMEARIAELQKETATAKVDSLIVEGKILPAQKDSAVALCASDAGMFEALYKDAPVVVDLERHSLSAGESGEVDDDDDELTPEEENLQGVLAHFGDE